MERVGTPIQYQYEQDRASSEDGGSDDLKEFVPETGVDCRGYPTEQGQRKPCHDHCNCQLRALSHPCVANRVPLPFVRGCGFVHDFEQIRGDNQQNHANTLDKEHPLYARSWMRDVLLLRALGKKTGHDECVHHEAGNDRASIILSFADSLSPFFVSLPFLLIFEFRRAWLSEDGTAHLHGNEADDSQTCRQRKHCKPKHRVIELLDVESL
mmetsp:Transcript_113249/g.283625  ORF Transcript_113249/g.283625 Transcript_113249/m.283625 type:complete len:211 (+) Transcript_113249:478-1110(+)